MTLPESVQIVEVGPRDGLQSEATIVPVDIRARLVEGLAQAGLRRVEVGSFVSERAVPQMARTGELVAKLNISPKTRLCALVPNIAGYRAAIAAGLSEVAVFASASETFSQRNINCSIDQSLDRYAIVAAEAKRGGALVRGYVSCALGCPYEGAIDMGRVVDVAKRLYEVGCYEISLADTIGVGTPLAARRLVEIVAREIPIECVSIHFHDTYGQALANTFACLEVGVVNVDSSVAGLGGCPYAQGATGNVATEDLVYMLHGCGIGTGVDLERLVEAGALICNHLGRASESRVARALTQSLATKRQALSSPIQTTDAQ